MLTGFNKCMFSMKNRFLPTLNSGFGRRDQLHGRNMSCKALTAVHCPWSALAIGPYFFSTACTVPLSIFGGNRDQCHAVESFVMGDCLELMIEYCQPSTGSAAILTLLLSLQVTIIDKTLNQSPPEVNLSIFVMAKEVMHGIARVGFSHCE